MATESSNEQGGSFRPTRTCMKRAVEERQLHATSTFSIKKPRRVLDSARALLKLPREIVHQILDDLTVFQVLQLASCQEDSTYLDQCILGHPKYQHLFESQKELTEVRDLFIVFHDIRASLHLDNPPDVSPLAHNIGTFSSNSLRVAHGHLPTFLCQDMRSHLTVVNKDRLEILERYSGPSLRGIHAKLKAKEKARDCQVYHDAWNQLLAAEQNVNDARASQLLQIADVFNQYPELLKRSKDPSQTPRANTDHIVSHFRDKARLVKGFQWLGPGKKHQTQYQFTYSHFPVVPFDSCLRLFCRFIDKNPASEPVDTSHKWTPYPAPVFQDIHTVVAGLENKYIKAVLGAYTQPTPVRRTKFINLAHSSKFQQATPIPLSDVVDGEVAEFHHWKPISQNVAGLFPIMPKGVGPREAWKLGTVPFAEAASPDDCWEVAHRHPVFTCPKSTHFGRLFIEKQVKEDSRDWLNTLFTSDDKELDWLRAFCRVVTYMQKAEAEMAATEVLVEKMRDQRLDDRGQE